MKFQQIGGIVLLFVFIAFLGFQLTSGLEGVSDGPIIVAMFVVIVLILVMLVRKIALEDR